MNRIRLLKYYFIVFGFLNIFVISFMAPLFFGDLLLGASALALVITANILHAIVMAVQAQNVFHLIIDVLPIGLIGGAGPVILSLGPE